MDFCNLENPLEILKSANVLDVLKKHWIINHENLIDPEKFVEDFFAEIKNLDSKRELNKIYQKKLKRYRNENLNLAKPEDMFLEIIKNDLRKAKTVLDFGCGKLTFLKNMAEKNPDIKKLIGVDLRSHPMLKDIDARIEFFRSLDDIADTSVDLVIIKLVLHHLDNEEEARIIFKELRRVLKADGKMIILEETFPDAVYSETEIKKYLAKFNLQLSESTIDFLQLSREDRIEFLFINDWLMNLQNDYMPWTGQYRSIEEWKEMIESIGFVEEYSHFLGAIKHRKRKQGMTAELIFRTE